MQYLLTLDGIVPCHLQIPLFQGMAPAEIESLAVVVTEKAYPPKSVVFYQGNEVEDLFFIQRGHVKVFRMLRHHVPARAVTFSTSHDLLVKHILCFTSFFTALSLSLAATHCCSTGPTGSFACTKLPRSV